MVVTPPATGGSAAAAREIARLRQAIEAIQRACEDGHVCDDVAWFSDHETLWDYCASVLNQSDDQIEMFELSDSVSGGSSRETQSFEGVTS